MSETMSKNRKHWRRILGGLDDSSCNMQLTPTASAVSYAQTFRVRVPCLIVSSGSMRQMSFYGIRHAFRLLEEAGILSIAVAHIPETVIRSMREVFSEFEPGDTDIEFSIIAINRSSDFSVNDYEVLFEIESCGQRTMPLAGSPMQLSMCKHALPCGIETMPATLSSHAAEHIYAASSKLSAGNEVTIFFDSAGFIRGSDRGALVLREKEKIHCLSSMRPILARVAARNFSSLGYTVDNDPVHMSETFQNRTTRLGITRFERYACRTCCT